VQNNWQQGAVRDCFAVIQCRIIGSRLQSGIALPSFSVECFVSFQFAILNIQIKIYRTVILPVVLCGCETWSLTMTEVRTQAEAV
jgi:hypothetical protein